MSKKFQFPSNGKGGSKDPILSPVGPWLQKPQKKHELRSAFFVSKFCLKIQQTRVYTGANAIFY